EVDRLRIDEVRNRVYSETETVEFIQDYHLLIEKYTTNNPVVLACTELSVFNPKNNNKNILDMAQLQITEAVKTVL
ncbi:MAG: aspartate racemase, partial [Porticoccaceae bacterium]